jgi:hypothetical protein
MCNQWLHLHVKRRILNVRCPCASLIKQWSTIPWSRVAERRYQSTILGFGIRWRWVVSFTPLPLYPRVKNPRYPLLRRLGGPRADLEAVGVEKNFTPAGNRTLAVQAVVIRTELFRLSTKGYYCLIPYVSLGDVSYFSHISRLQKFKNTF